MPDETERPSAGATAAVAPVAVTVWGIDRGAEFGGPGSVSLDDGGVLVALDDGALRRYYPFGAIDGVRVRPAPGDASGAGGSSGGGSVQLTLFLGHGDVAELTGPRSLREVAGAAERAACALAEQTLALRAFGSHRASAGSDHDRFFGPLLAARRAAERAGCAVDHVTAFDAVTLRRAFDQTLASFAADRFPDAPPDRRALEAELRDLAEPLDGALRRLAAAGAAVRESADDARFARWREWSAVVRDLFAAADAVWIAALPALSVSRGRRGRLWRRVLGRRR